MKLSLGAMAVLQQAEIDGTAVRLGGVVELHVQVEVGQALESVGGLWSDGAFRFVFDPKPILVRILETGEVHPIQTRPKVLSYGGGLNSFALLLDALSRGEKPDVVVFIDVTDPVQADPGEWPGTYQHIREVVMPLCEREGIRFVWLDTTSYPVRGTRSLFDWMWQRGQIPVTGSNRLCTIIAKVERFELWMDYTFPGRDVEVWIGFEAGEESRAANDPNAGTRKRSKSKRGPDPARRVNRFPLMERGLCRCRCEALVRRFGYPVPRKSACCWCPYGTKGDWQTFARDLPEHFARVVQLEAKKPLTERGLKLSIMGFKAIKDRATGEKVGYKAPPLPDFIQGTYRRKLEPCRVCGAAVRATKEAGCGYLP